VRLSPQRALHGFCPWAGSGSIIGIRDRAVILLGYGSAMRPGEISALNLADIVPKPTGVLINVRRSKTDQAGQGQLIGVARGQHRETDPIQALDAWLARSRRPRRVVDANVPRRQRHRRPDRTSGSQPHRSAHP